MMIAWSRQQKSRGLFACVLIAWFVANAKFATAQLKLEEGEEVKVMFLNDWREGTVLEVRGDKYGVQYRFGSSFKQDYFDRAAVRMLCEVGAIDFARTWVSSSGTFKVDAALHGFDGDKVVLMKLDLTEISVPSGSLSPKDVAYIEKMRKRYDAAVARGELPAPTPKLPDVQVFAKEFSTSPLVGIGDSQPSVLGTVPSFLTTFKQAGLGFNPARERQEIIAIIPVGGPEQLVLVSTSEFWASRDNFPNCAYWVSLKQQKILGQVHVNPGHLVVDYDPRTRMTLSVKFGEGAFTPHSLYTMWRLNPGETKIEPLICWESPLQRTEGIFVKIVNERTVLAKTGRNSMVAWDLVDKKEAYAVTLRSFFEAPVRMTWDRRHLIVPYDGGVSIFHAATGDLAFNLPLGGESVSGANVNESGTKLAAVTSKSLYLWNLEDANPKPIEFAAPLVGNPFRSQVEWVDDDHVFVEGFRGPVLFRLSLELPIWRYDSQHTHSQPTARGFDRRFMLNGHYFYHASPDPFGRTLAVGAVKLPGPQVNEVVGNIKQEQLMVLYPGVRVRFGTMSVTQPELVQEWLEERFSQLGWSVDPNAEIVIDCAMTRGTPQTETYSGIRGGEAPTTVSFTPYESSIKIRRGNAVLWQAGVSTGAPMILHGDDIQAQINRLQQPQLDFFRSVQIPAKILDPKFGNGFGSSKFTTRGIEVVSATPPGRDDDPDEMAKQQSEQWNKDRADGNQGTRSSGFPFDD